MGFITVNGSVLDEEEYGNEVSALRFELMYELTELFAKYGFEVAERKTVGYDRLQLVFSNKRLSLTAAASLRKEEVSKKTDTL